MLNNRTHYDIDIELVHKCREKCSFGGGPSGGGTTTVQQNAPQLLPEGKEGYLQSQQYFQDRLKNPPIFEGQRVAPVNPTQQAYMDQNRSYFGQPQPVQTGASNQILATETGQYPYNPNEPGSVTRYGDQVGRQALDYTGNVGRETLTYAGDVGDEAWNRGSKVGGANRQVAAPQANYSPTLWHKPSDTEIQKFTSSAIMPYTRHLEESTLPQINSDFGVAGGGVNNTREGVSKSGAIKDTNTQISQEVIAPIFNKMTELDQQFTSAENERRAAIASGDADRISRASAVSAQLATQLDQAKVQLAGQLGTAEMGIAGDLGRTQMGITGDLAGKQMGLGATEAQQNIDAYQGERNRQLKAAEMSSQVGKDEAFRQMMLKMGGDYERSFEQENLAAQRAEWEEPIQEQTNAANALFGASGMGPGSASSSQQSSSSQGAMSTISQVAQIAMMAAAIYAKS